MIVPFVALSVLTGVTKSVSVCGVNSAAMVASPRRRTRTVVYLAALTIGAFTLVGALLGAGELLKTLLAVPLEARRAAAVAVMVAFALVELVRGPNGLPHIAWAVSRQIAERGLAGVIAFGWIRGVAVFNHSPFASMHALLVVVVLLPESVPAIVIALLFAAGLA